MEIELATYATAVIFIRIQRLGPPDLPRDCDVYTYIVKVVLLTHQGLVAQW